MVKSTTLNGVCVCSLEAPREVVVAASDVDFNVASLGDNVTLMCSSDGGPDNTYQWMKDGIVLNESDSTIIVNVINASSGGDYTCTVSNTAGNDSASTTLYVAPYIITPLKKQTPTANGSNVNINCDAAGFPSPTVNWVGMTNMKVSNTSLLQFNPVMFGDEGLYLCVASVEIDGVNFNATDKTTLVGMFSVVIILCVTTEYLL